MSDFPGFELAGEVSVECISPLIPPPHEGYPRIDKFLLFAGMKRLLLLRVRRLAASLLILLIVSATTALHAQRPFITTWKTGAANETITIPVHSEVTGYDYAVDWGDGTTSDAQTGNATHTYAEAGTYTVSVSGNFPAINFGSSASDDANAARLLTVEQWGDQVWQGMRGAFFKCKNLTTVSGTDAPVFAAESSLDGMFARCGSFNSNLNHWDMSNVVNTAWMFNYATSFTGAIGQWNVSAVTTMEAMFEEAHNFNSDISGWNVSNVTNMSRMFFMAKKFNQPIGGWDVSKVTTMYGLFDKAEVFNQDIGDWNVANVEVMSYMFIGAKAFNRNIGDWNVSKVATMTAMFAETDAFNQYIGDWDVSKVTDFSWMFSFAKAFNQDLDWDVSRGTNFQGVFRGTQQFNGNISNWNLTNAQRVSWMFNEAVLFNQDLSSWNLARVNTMERMFMGASSFDKSLGQWNLSNVTDVRNMLSNSGLSRENYDATLMGWVETGNLRNNLNLGAAGLKYCLGKGARQRLIDDFNWTITGDALKCPPVITPGDQLVLYVDLNVNTGAPAYTGSGDSWSNAIPQLAEALKWAREQYAGGNPGWDGADPLKIYVASGTYLPAFHAGDESYTTDGGRHNAFVLVPDVQLYGGFDPANGVQTLEDERLLPQSVNVTRGTILSGDLGRNDHATDFNGHTENAHHVVIAAGTLGVAKMDGFIITAGAATEEGASLTVNGQSISSAAGGGTSVVFSRLWQNDCLFLRNTSIRGGGMSNVGGDFHSVLTKTVFLQNAASERGGALYSNRASVTLENSKIMNNTAAEGGGVYNELSPSVLLSNFVFSGNSAITGGAMMNTNCSSTELINGTVTGNAATLSGGALVKLQSPAVLTNLIIWDNEIGGIATSPEASIYTISGGLPVVSHSLVANWGGSDRWNPGLGMDGGGNMDTDPVFTDAAGGDYTLQACSPAINSGDNSDIPGESVDITGRPRTVHTVVDLGAFEFQDAVQHGGLAQSEDESTTPINGVTSFYGNGEACRLIARIAPAGANPVSGSMTVRVSLDPEVAFHNNSPYVQRHYLISAPAGGSAKITLYFTQEEFDSFNEVLPEGPLPANASDAVNKKNLRVFKYEGTNGTSPGDYEGAPLAIIPNEENILWNAASHRWEVTFYVDGFSGFFIGSAAKPLPVKLVSFVGSSDEHQAVALRWGVTEQQNMFAYDVEHSRDGRTFVHVGTVPATTESDDSFTFRHLPPAGGIAYYRLRLLEADGRSNYSKIISVQLAERPGVSAYPLPAGDVLWIEARQIAGTTGTLLNMQGMVLKTLTFYSDKQQVDLGSLPQGMYFIRLHDGTSLKVVKK